MCVLWNYTSLVSLAVLEMCLCSKRCNSVIVTNEKPESQGFKSCSFGNCVREFVLFLKEDAHKNSSTYYIIDFLHQSTLFRAVEWKGLPSAHEYLTAVNWEQSMVC